MERSRIIIIGAGVAGLSLAYFLSRRGMNDVIVLESERALGVHSSGRSNSNFIHLFEPAAVAALSVASEEFLYKPDTDFSPRPLAVPRGSVVTVSKKDLKRHYDEMQQSQKLGIKVEEISSRKIEELVPILRLDDIAAAAYYPDSGPIDTSELLGLYVRHSRSAGAKIHYDRAFLGVDTLNGRISGVRTTHGPIACETLVNAAGAWAGPVGLMAGGTPIPFSARRRHLISVRLPPQWEKAQWPFVRCNSIPMYFKGDNGRLVASPMDEDEVAPQDCPTDDLRIAQIADDLNAHTTLKIRHIESSWAGLRTFAPDRMPVVGFDRQIEGLFWLAGQGGTGIQTSPALGNIASRLILGQAPTAGEALLSPARWPDFAVSASNGA